MKNWTIFIMIILPFLAKAQEEAADTVATLAAQELHEVVVAASPVVHKADMDVYRPSASAVANAKDGVQLLNNLMIPEIVVNDAMQTITTYGEAVQLRINGRMVGIEQVKSLLPESIKKVEWINNPGLRYGKVAGVLNFIVTNPTVGGSLMLSARPALNLRWGTYNADVKLNSGRSQWNVGALLKATNHISAHRDYYERFTYPDLTTLTRRETPREGYVCDTWGNAWLSYSYVKPDTTTFYVSLSSSATFDTEKCYNGTMTLSNSDEQIYITDNQGMSGYKPSLSMYLEQHFERKQTLVVDCRASAYYGDTYTDYLERRTTATLPHTNVHTFIHDSNKAFGMEANYIKEWDNSKFTAGINYGANRNRSSYHNLEGAVFHQRQDRMNLYGEYLAKVGKFALTAGLGANWVKYKFVETRQGNSEWMVRPQLSVDYQISPRTSLRLGYQMWQDAPTLSQTNVVAQQIDGFQWVEGNPNLKMSKSYKLSLTYRFFLPRINASLSAIAYNNSDAITTCLGWRGDRLVTGYENSKGLRNIALRFSPQVVVIPQWLMASGSVSFRHERMEGADYLHYHNNWSGNVAVMATHYGFTLSCQYICAEKTIYGEVISWPESISLVDLTYNWKKWSFAIGMIMPFGKYDQGSMLINKWNTNENHMRADIRLPYISVSYNLRWGKQKRNLDKLINVGVDVDRSSAAGR